MADTQERLIRTRECAPAEVRGVFAAVRLDKVLIAEGDDFERAMRCGRCFRVTDDSGMTAGAYVLQEQGPEVWISAAAGRAGFDLTAALAALIERQAHGFDSIAFQTRRRGLVAKARRHGYAIAGHVGDCGYIMRKRLK